MGLGGAPQCLPSWGTPELTGCHLGTVDSSQLAVSSRSRSLLPPGGLTGSGRPTAVLVAAGTALALCACVCLRRASEGPVGLRVHLRVPLRLLSCVSLVSLQTQADPPPQEGGGRWVGVISPRGTGWGSASRGTQPQPVRRLEKVRFAEAAEAEAPRGLAGGRGGARNRRGAQPDGGPASAGGARRRTPTRRPRRPRPDPLPQRQRRRRRRRRRLFSSASASGLRPLLATPAPPLPRRPDPAPGPGTRGAMLPRPRR